MVDNTMISACYCTQGDGLNSTSKTAEANLCHIFQLFNTCYKDNGLWATYFMTIHGVQPAEVEHA